MVFDTHIRTQQYYRKVDIGRGEDENGKMLNGVIIDCSLAVGIYRLLLLCKNWIVASVTISLASMPVRTLGVAFRK